MGKWGRLTSRHAHSAAFLALLGFNMIGCSYFLQLVHFRALSGWESELGFDSLTFNWKLISTLVILLDGLAATEVALSFWIEGLYRLYGLSLGVFFLMNVVFPFAAACPYVRGFSFILALGMVLNGWAFVTLTFLKRRTGLVDALPEEGDLNG